MKIDRLSLEEMIDIELNGRAEIRGNRYTYKDYHYKSAIYKNGILYASIDNRKPLDDPERFEILAYREKDRKPAQDWKIFIDQETGAELAAYTVMGEARNEEAQTRALLAYEKGIDADRITTRTERR